MELKLRDCPFCGGTAEIKTVRGRDGTQFVMAKCTSCGAQGHTCLDKQGERGLIDDPAARMAGMYWNARVDE